MESRARRAAARMARLVRIMDRLRAPGGCPWDRRQTHATLGPFLIEEAYEAVDAIDRDDRQALSGELGDVLFQCVFHAQLAAERGEFDLADTIERITDKLIRRHPHVFTPGGRPRSAGGTRVRTPEAVVEQWERLKAREQADAGVSTRVLAGVPRAMPALLRAHEIGVRVAAVGFDWPGPAQVLDKIDEEARELREAVTESPARAAEELGDLLFSLVMLARRRDVDPEQALERANHKFTERFGRVEDELRRRAIPVESAGLELLDRIWDEVKRDER